MTRCMMQASIAWVQISTMCPTVEDVSPFWIRFWIILRWCWRHRILQSNLVAIHWWIGIVWMWWYPWLLKRCTWFLQRLSDVMNPFFQREYFWLQCWICGQCVTWDCTFICSWWCYTGFFRYLLFQFVVKLSKDFLHCIGLEDGLLLLTGSGFS